MQKDVLRIAFAGPSGLGRASLANKIAEAMPDLPHPSTSPREVFQKGDHNYLWDNFGYKGDGHRAVINLSGANPDFGLEFQRILLKRRIEQMANLYDSGYILDKCPIDNITYILSQVGHNISEEKFREYLTLSRAAYQVLTHVILLRYSPDIPVMVGDGKNIPNRFFQRYMSDVFMGVFNRYFSDILGPRVMIIDFWDPQQRFETVRNFIIETDGDKEQTEA